MGIARDIQIAATARASRRTAKATEYLAAEARRQADAARRQARAHAEYQRALALWQAQQPAPAGWYTPQGETRRRYWDGAAWTDFYA